MPAPPYRLMLVANRTGPCPTLADVVHAHLAGRPAEVHVVAPALISRLRWAVSDTDDATAEAHERLRVAINRLEGTGLRATGEVGDANPLTAIEDALPRFAANGVLISTWPRGRSNWLERDLVGHARARLSVDVHHVITDFGAPGPAGAANDARRLAASRP